MRVDCEKSRDRYITELLFKNVKEGKTKAGDRMKEEKASVKRKESMSACL